MPWHCGTYNTGGSCPFTSGTAAPSGAEVTTTTDSDMYAGLPPDALLTPLAVDSVNDSFSSISFLFFTSPSSSSSSANWSSMSGSAVDRQASATLLRHLQSDAGSSSSGSHVDSTMDINGVIELYVIGVLVVFGLLGNVTSVVVLRRYRERRDALFLLQALAVADGLYLAVAGVRYPLKYVLTSGNGHGNRYVEMQPIVVPLLKTFQTVTIWMMVLVTVDRYCCVCRPLDAPRCFNWASRRRFAVAIFLSAFAYNTPRFLDSCVVRWVSPCTGPDTEIAIELMVYRETFRRALYFDIYVDGLYLMLLYIGPLCILVYMNVRLVQAIRKSRLCQNCGTSHRGTSTARTWSLSAESRPTHSASSSDKNATVVLIIVVIVFVVCATPELVLKLITFTERNFDLGLHYSSGMVHLNVTSELLMVVNSSINFVIYVAFGRRFRQILRQTFSCRSLLRLLKSRGAAAPTAVTHDMPPPAHYHQRQVIAAAGFQQRHPRALQQQQQPNKAPLQPQRLQYHHNCVHVQAACGGKPILRRVGNGSSTD